MSARWMVSRAFTRKFSSPVGLHHNENAGATAKKWKKMFFFVAVPAMCLGLLNSYLIYKEEKNHERPKFIPYDHMRIRTKRFPWGDGTKSLFHHPEMNALPNGYEDEQ